MAISYVASAFYSSGTCNSPAGTTAGDGLVAFCANRLGATFPATPAGWRAVTSVSDGVTGIAIIVFARRATGSDSFAFPANCTHVTIGTWRGVRADVAGSAVINTSGGVALSPVTYPGIDSLKTRSPWVAEYSFTTNSTALPASAPSGMTRRAANATASPAGSSVLDDTDAVITGAFAAKTATLSTAAPWLSASVELLPVAPDVPVEARAGQEAGFAAYQAQSGARASQDAALVAYGPPASKLVRAGQEAGLAPRAAGINALPHVSQVALLVAYGEGVPDARRSRAWWFTFDGHTFYVLDLGEEGTYVYDLTTQQWARWYTDAYAGQWNMKCGTMWGPLRVVAGDSVTGQTWLLDPTQGMDEGWRMMDHVVTGGIMLRGRVYVGMSSLNITGSAGQITSDDGTAEIRLRFSDDMGKTWSDPYPLVLTEGDFSDETAWRSLGSFCNPGRVLEISDTGGMIRIDGLDANLSGFDAPPSPATGVRRG